MKIATIIATPSTQSTGGSPAGRGVPKSWKNPNARETIAAMDRSTCTGGHQYYEHPKPRVRHKKLVRTKTLSLSASHMSCRRLFVFRDGSTFCP